MNINITCRALFSPVFLIVLSLLIMISCKSTDPFLSASKLSELKAHIHSQLDTWHKAAADTEAQAYFNLIANDGIYIGTDASEVWTKDEFLEFAMPYFDQGKAWEFKRIDRNLYFTDDRHLVWFDELLDTWMGTCRGSGVLEWNENQHRFEIKHYVLSLTIPNEKINDVIDLLN